jgi:hypothetical protein
MTIKALYPTVRPTLNLDFAKTKALDPRVTFTRASTATFVGADGLIQTAASGAPRFDHNPATGESLGLLVEEARTNLVLRSEELNASPWGWTNNSGIPGTVIANSDIAPNGTLTATEIQFPLIPGGNYINRVQTFTPVSNPYVFSVWLKAKSPSDIGKTIRIQIFQSSTSIVYELHVLTSAWKRISTSPKTLPGGAAVQIEQIPGQDAVNVLAWGAQVEAGAFPTSYIPTTGSTVTRAADIASMTGTNFSSWYRQDEGSLFGQYVLRGGNEGLLRIWDGNGAALNYWAIGPSSPAGGVLGLTTRSTQGTVVGVYNRGRIDDATNLGYVVKHAAAIAANDFACYTRSGSGDFDNNTGSTVPASGGYLPPLVDRLTLAESSGPFLLNASITIARLAYYPVRLPDAQLQALTAT